MSSPNALGPADRPRFVEGWHDIGRFNGNVDIKYLTVQSLCRIVDLSRQAAEELGESHRDFKVGTAAYVLDEPGQRVGVYFGGNFTPYEGAPWNCAEKRAMGTIQARGFNRVLAVAVSGPPQVDNSGVESPTLHPCDKCRAMFEQSELTAPDMLVATSTPDGSAHELHTLESLLKRHETGQEQPFPDYHFLLPHYWDQLLAYDAEDEKADLARLDLIAKAANPRL